MHNQDFIFTQLNFWGGRLYYPITRFLERVKPDIFSMQEVYKGAGSTKPDHMTAEMLLDDDHQYFNGIALGGCRNGFTTAEGYDRKMCCATAVKKTFKVISKKRIPIDVFEENDPWGHPINVDYFNLLHVVLENEKGARLNVLNFHNPVVIGPNGRDGGEAGDHHFKQVKEYIETLVGPLIFSGDFNLRRRATSLQYLKNTGLKNLNEVYDISANRNEFAWKEEDIASHVFINDQIIVRDYYVAEDNVSDHKALVMIAQI